jgi:hypothetical protein
MTLGTSVFRDLLTGASVLKQGGAVEVVRRPNRSDQYN